MRKLIALSMLSAFGALSMAQYIPAIPETSGLNTMYRTAPRTYAQYVDESLMTGLTQPTLITGITLRLAAGVPNGVVSNAWPPSNINFSDFTVKIGRASAAVQAASEFPSLGTFNSYFDPSASIVRSGALSIGANSFTYNPLSSISNAVFNPWGYTLNFTTPYLYTPGTELIYAVSHTGYGASPTQAFFAAGNYSAGQTDAVSFAGTSTFDTVAGNFSSPYVIQFQTAPVPEPGTIAALSLGLAALARRRKAKKA